MRPLAVRCAPHHFRDLKGVEDILAPMMSKPPVYATLVAAHIRERHTSGDNEKVGARAYRRHCSPQAADASALWESVPVDPKE